MRTNFTNQALRDDRVNRRRKQKWLNSHIDDTRERFCGRVCMDGRNYEMPREWRFNRNIDSVVITNFTHHNNIRVLTKGSTKSTRERVSNIRKNLWLVESVNLVFYWIFECHDIYVWLIEARKTWIKCCWFTRTSWPRSQDNSIWKADSLFKKCTIFSFNTEIIEIRNWFGLVHDTHHNFFSMNGWECRNTQVKRFCSNGCREASILRNSRFVNF